MPYITMQYRNVWGGAYEIGLSDRLMLESLLKNISEETTADLPLEFKASEKARTSHFMELRESGDGDEHDVLIQVHISSTMKGMYENLKQHLIMAVQRFLQEQWTLQGEQVHPSVDIDIRVR